MKIQFVSSKNIIATGFPLSRLDYLVFNLVSLRKHVTFISFFH